MKILLVGQFKRWALENHYAKYLLNHADVSIYPAEDVFDDYYRKSIYNKLKVRAGLSGIYDRISEELLARVDTEQPDVVWIFKGMRILPKTIQAIRDMGAKTANYNPDHPFFFSGPGSGNRYVTEAIGLYDLHLCYSHEVQRRIEREHGIPTAFLPFAFELSGEDFDEIKNTPEVPTACFIGNPDKIRTAHILALAKAGLPMDVYGYGWEKFLANTPNVRTHTAVLGKEFLKTMRAYRLQLNVFRPHNEGSHNMRTFEVPAVGGIMLAPDSPEHQEFFTEGKEIFLYKNIAEMVAKAKHILSLPAEEAAAIRHHARQRSLQAGYAYEHRAAQAFEAFERVLSYEAVQ
ncbi:MAG: glycosyltransferase family 1 protein [Lewinellaceae bacterium]|nr:glycosyltransferase family 1 protein [Saprospiraceae bacterium]MCB9338343.1 glycosyltransferase family 1 protein [Lewinellaceae bacterium]